MLHRRPFCLARPRDAYAADGGDSALTPNPPPAGEGGGAWHIESRGCLNYKMSGHLEGVISPLTIPSNCHSKHIGIGIKATRLKSERKLNLCLPRRCEIEWLNKWIQRKSMLTTWVFDDATQNAIVSRANCWGQRRNL